jgi:hypothetical protein
MNRVKSCDIEISINGRRDGGVMEIEALGIVQVCMRIGKTDSHLIWL